VLGPDLVGKQRRPATETTVRLLNGPGNNSAAIRNGVTYQRVCFAAKALKHHPDYQLDDGILGAKWLTRDELLTQRDRWRSELVIRCIDDYLAGHRHSLELIRPSL